MTLDLRYFDHEKQQWVATLANGEDLDQLAVRTTQISENLIQTKEELTSQLAQIDDEIAQVTQQSAQNSVDLESRGFNVTKLSNEDVDITSFLQTALDTYKHVYVPSGTYTVSNLEFADGTFLELSKDAVINVTGKFTNPITQTKTYSKSIVADASIGSSTLTLIDVADVSVGDEVLVYNGGWVAESIWIENAKLENPVRMRKQLMKIKSVDAANNTVTLETPLDFELDSSLACDVSYFAYSKNIRIKGGKFNTVGAETINFKNVKNLEIDGIEVSATSSNMPIYIEYIFDSCLKNSTIINTEYNGGIWLARHCDNVQIVDNKFYAKDSFHHDATILVYDYCRNINVSRNLVVFERDKPFNNTDIYIGITIHTDSMDCIVSENLVKGFYYGVTSYFGAKRNVFSKNKIEHCVGGVLIQNASYTLVSDNMISACGLEGSANANNRGAIVFAPNTASYRVTVDKNLIQNCHSGVVLNSNTKGLKISKNIIVDWINRAIDNGTQPTHRNISIVDNNLKLNGDTKVDAIFLYGTFENGEVSRNVFENVGTAIRFFNDFIGGRIRENTVYGCDTFLHLRYNARYNDVSGNIVDTALIRAVNIESNARVNNFNNNTFINVAERFNLTDIDNMSGSHLNSAPVGFKVYSFDPASDWIYYEKLNSTATLLNGWQKIRKLI